MEALRGLIANELPHENYLETASWYRGIGRGDDAAKVLELAPPTAEVLYWLAFLRRDPALLARAEKASPAFVFPFRPESIPVFEWAAVQNRAWQPRYYLALVRWHLGEAAKARELLAACGEEPRFGPFYAARAQLLEETAPRDLRRAAQLDPGQWRYGAMLAKHYLKRGETVAACEAAGEFARKFPANTVLALLHAKTLVLTRQYQEAANLLNSLNVLPCEGSTEARALYHQANMWLAVQQMKAGHFDRGLPLLAAAREWPERLGAGKPYPEDVDERLEDWLTYQCHLKRQAPEEARRMLDKILAFQPCSKRNGAGTIIRALALKAGGRGSEGEKLLGAWLKQEPTDPMAKWGIEVFAGRRAALPANLHDEEFRLLAAGMP
jgi:predicted Zn-dependent protease